MIKKVHYLHFIIFLLIYSLKALAQIQVEAGDLSYFYVEYKQTIMAGESIPVKIIAKDPFDNDIENFSGIVDIIYDGKSEKVKIERGVGRFNFSTTKIGKYDFRINYNGKIYLVKDKYTNGLLNGFKIYVKNGPAEKVDIITSPEFIPGYTKRLKLVAKDAYGNLVSDTSGVEQTLSIESNGTFKTTLDIKSFNNGSKEIEFVPLDLHDIILKVKSDGKTLGEAKLEYKKQEIGEIKVAYPEKVKAGQEFDFYIAVYDTNGLLIKVYDKIGKPIKLTHNGKGILYPDTIEPSAFVNGEATVKLVYTKSEEIKIKPVIEDKTPSIVREEKPKKTEPVKKEPEKPKTLKEEEKPKPVEKSAITSRLMQEPVKILNLIIPKNFGKIDKVIEKGKNEYLVMIADRNENFDFVPIERDIKVKNRNIGKLRISADNNSENLILKLNILKEYKVEVKPDKDNNLIRVEIYE